MTVSYLHSPSFSANNTFSEYNHASPPESPIASSESSSSPRVSSSAFGTSVPAAAVPASGSADRSVHHLITLASAPVVLDQLAEALGILIPNDRMEAGLSLRRSPLGPTKEFSSDPRSSDSDASRHWNHRSLLDDVEANETLYQTGYTGDIDLHGKFVYQRPYLNRASSSSKRRSQLILEQKFSRHRSNTASTNDSDLAPRSSISYRSNRPGTASQRTSTSPLTPDCAPGRPEPASKVNIVSSGGGLRELSTEAAAQPASKRASWLQRSRDFEAHSDSQHSQRSVSPATPSTKASRRHSSFLSGDLRSTALMPILTSNSFAVPEEQSAKRRSYITGKPRTPVTAEFDALEPSSSQIAGEPSSQRNSMLSNDSSATSSRGEPNVEFDGDEANHQAHSSASSGFEHEEVLASKATTSRAEGGLDPDSKATEVFTTPRSSTEADQADDSSKQVPSETSGTGQQAVDASQNDIAPGSSALNSKDIADTSRADSEPVAAPAIPTAMVSPVQTSVVPPSPTASRQPSPERDVASPSSSSAQISGVPDARGESPTEAPSSLSQTSLDQKPDSNSATPFGALAVPAGKANGVHTRRDSSTSLASAASSSSTYRIRRKAVPSDLGDPERRPSMVSVASTDAGEVSSLRSSVAPTLPPKDEAVHAIQAALMSSGSVPARMASDSAHSHSHESDAFGDDLLKEDRARPSTAATPSTKPGTFGLGLAQLPQASASARNVSSKSATTTGGNKLGASRTASRATIKRPTTAPVGTAGQLRAASEAQKAFLEVEGQQFVLGKEQATKDTSAQAASPSIPNAVRFLQPKKGGLDVNGGSKRDSMLDAKSISSSNGHGSRRLNNASTDSKAVGSNDPAMTKSSSAKGGWGLEQELKIVDKVQNANGANPSKAQKPRRASIDKSRKSLDAASKAHLKNNLLMNIINEDESDEVKAAAREAGIPEGSYAIHPPSMLQLFEASQCLVYNQEGQEVLFGDLFKKRRTLVCFLRHWWCGFCQQFAMSVRNIDPLPLKKANLDFVIIGQGDWHVIKAYREVMQVQYPMFADPKRSVYRALGMTLRTNDANPVCARPDYASMSMTKGILVAIKKGLFDMPIRNPGDMKLLGGDFILGPGLQCSFTHRMTTADGHMDIPRILAQAGCDMSLKTPKPMFTLDEKATRSATLAGGNQNRRQTRSMGRSRGKKSNATEPMDSNFGTTTASAAAGSVGHGGSNPRSRPSLWGRFPGRFSRSQVSLPASASVADLSTDFSHDRGFAAGPRSASAMRKISYDGRVRDSVDTQQTDLEFESRATSFDTRGRPSDVSAPFGFGSLNKAQSMSELRKRFEMGGLSSFRSKLRQDPSASKVSLDGRLAVPGSGNRLNHSASSKSLRGAAQANGASTPTQQSVTGSKQANGEKADQPSVFRNNVIARPSGLAAPAADTNGLGMTTGGDDVGMRDGSSTGHGSHGHAPAAAGLSAPGSFLMDLDVYDSLSRQPSQKVKDNSLLVPSAANGGLSPSQDSGFSHQPAQADSDTEPSMSPARSQRGEGGHTQSSSYQSFNTFRAKPLEHLVEETDEDGDDSRDQLEDSDEDEEEEVDDDEPIEFEHGLSGRF